MTYQHLLVKHEVPISTITLNRPEKRNALALDVMQELTAAGVPFAEFSQVMRTAFDSGGASGFIAGRSVWREAVALDGAPRDVSLHGAVAARSRGPARHARLFG